MVSLGLQGMVQGEHSGKCIMYDEWGRVWAGEEGVNWQEITGKWRSRGCLTGELRSSLKEMHRQGWRIRCREGRTVGGQKQRQSIPVSFCSSLPAICRLQIHKVEWPQVLDVKMAHRMLQSQFRASRAFSFLSSPFFFSDIKYLRGSGPLANLPLSLSVWGNVFSQL